MTVALIIITFVGVLAFGALLVLLVVIGLGELAAALGLVATLLRTRRAPRRGARPGAHNRP